MTWQGSRQLLVACATALAAAVAASPAAATPVPAGVASLQPNTAGAGSHLLLDARGADAGFRQNSIPSSLGWAFEKGFELNAAAAPAKCTVDQAKKEQCPPDSRLERLLSWPLPAKPMHEPVAGRIDFVLSEDLEVRPA